MSTRSPEERTELVAEGLLTINESAEFLRLSRAKIYQLMDTGELCFAKLGRARRISRRAVVELAVRNLRGGTHMDA